MKNRLCLPYEAVANINYLAAEEKYQTQNSREMISRFIEWANDFKYLQKNIEVESIPFRLY